VLGACYSGILRIEGATAIPWISRFLASADDPAAEAALAIASTHSPQGFERLRERFAEEADPWFRSVLLSAIVLTARMRPSNSCSIWFAPNRSKPKPLSKLSSGLCPTRKSQSALKNWWPATSA
jgi:hypothetical protein